MASLDDNGTPAFYVMKQKYSNDISNWIDDRCTFYVSWDGFLYSENASIAGKINAISGKISHWVIEDGRLYDNSGDHWTGVNKNKYGAAFYAGGQDVTGYSSPFKVYHDGTLYATKANITGNINATSGSFTGEINASSGKIGGWKITEASIYDEKYYGEQAGINSWGAGAAFWAGGRADGGGNAPFHVLHDGTLYATKANITGNINATSGKIGSWGIGEYQVCCDCIMSYGDSGSPMFKIGLQAANGYNVENHPILYSHQYDFHTSENYWAPTVQRFNIFADGTIKTLGNIYGDYLTMRFCSDASLGQTTCIIPCEANNDPQVYLYRGKIGFSHARWSQGYFGTLYCDSPQISSDKKLKNHLEYLFDNEQIDNFIMGLKPVGYTLKNGTGNRKHLGLYAQDVSKIAMQTVGDLSLFKASRDKIESNSKINGDIVYDEVNGYYSNDIPDEDLSWSLNYIELIPPIITMIQKNNIRSKNNEVLIEQLQNEINDLKAMAN